MKKKKPVEGYWGQHLILNALCCDYNKARDKDYISAFIKQLVKEIDMVPFGEPQLVHFADGTDKAGWTAIQLIETSNIMAHFVDDNGDLYLDVFSCKYFDDNVVKNLLKKWFEPVKVSCTNMYRDANIGNKTELFNADKCRELPKTHQKES